MITTAAQPKRNVSAEEARDVAEAAREEHWAAPSFVRDLFLGKLRMDLIHPYPEQDAEEVARAKPFLEKLEQFLRQRVGSDKIDREGEIPEEGVPGPLKMFGNDAQKKRYLPRLAKGAISAFALTEPGVGSDPAAMDTLAVPSEDGQAWILNGEKLWCTNGTKAELLVVMARTPSKVVNGKEKRQITAFI